MKISQILLTLLIALQIVACQSAKKDPWGTEIRWAVLPATFTVDKAIAENPDAIKDIENSVNFWNERAGKAVLKYEPQEPPKASNLQPNAKSETPTYFAGSLESPKKIYTNILFYPEEWPLSADIAGKTVMIRQTGIYENAMIALNKNKLYCYGECKDISSAGTVSFRRLIAHELGHFIGLSHIDDKNNLLYPILLPSGDLSLVTIDEKSLIKLTH